MLPRLIAQTKRDLQNRESVEVISRETVSLKDALSSPGTSVIAEIKRATPTKTIDLNLDARHMAAMYHKKGASAVSVLTSSCFRGSLRDLSEARKGSSLPILQKDFIVDLSQLTEARSLGADAVLLIVAVLADKTQQYLLAAHQMGLDCLVEVHTPEEVELAVAAGAQIIGVNNRSLEDLSVDTDRARDLASHIPEGIIKVAESGYTSRSQLQQLTGFDGVLIGEGCVRAKDTPHLLLED